MASDGPARPPLHRDVASYKVLLTLVDDKVHLEILSISKPTASEGSVEEELITMRVPSLEAALDVVQGSLRLAFRKIELPADDSFTRMPTSGFSRHKK